MSLQRQLQTRLEKVEFGKTSMAEAKKLLKVFLLGSGDRRPQILAEVERLRPEIESCVEIVGEDFSYQQN